MKINEATIMVTSQPRAGRRGPMYAARPNGFTLIEVLFSMAILAIGLLAVASLFPVAAIQQKRALDDLSGSSFGSNVLAMFQAVGKENVVKPSLWPTSSTPAYSPVNHVTSPALATDYANDSTVYLYSDPNGLYDFRIAYRIPNVGDDMRVAVFVFRKPPQSVSAADPVVAVYSLDIAQADINNSNAQTPNSTLLKIPSSASIDAFRKNQAVMICDKTSGDGFVGKIIGAWNDSGNNYAQFSPKMHSAPTGDVTLYYLGDNTVTAINPSTSYAVSIVEGIIP